MTLTRKRTENLSVLNTSFAVKGASFGKLLGNWQKWEKTNTEDEEGFEKICSESSQSSSVRNSIHSLNSSVAKSTILSTMKTFTRSVCSVLSEESMTSFTFAPDEFHEIYEVGKELGSGAFAVVYETSHKKTGKSYAVKKMNREGQNASDLEAVKLEISIMYEMNHPNIVRLIDTFDEPDHLYIVMEKVVGGELLERLAEKEYYNEKEARDACVILFHTMDYCHRRKVAHRDLKPENLLLESVEDDSKLKIADFGLAKRCPKDGLKTLCGTPNYVAPEVIRREPYNWQCDVWSLGVIVYILLGGYSPFDESDQKTLFKRIIHADYAFHPKYWSEVSEDAKDFIEALLNTNPRERLTCSQALCHNWMTVDDDVLAAQSLDSTVQELKKYNAKRKFRAAVKTLIAINRMSCF